MKVGTNLTRGWNGFTYENLSPVTYRLNNAIPNQISQRAFPILRTPTWTSWACSPRTSGRSIA